MDLFGDDEAAGKYMLDAINEDTRANTTQPIAEEDAQIADLFLNMFGDADEEDDDFASAAQSTAACSSTNVKTICMVTSVD